MYWAHASQSKLKLLHACIVNKRFYRYSIFLICTSLLAGCGLSAISPAVKNISAPEAWPRTWPRAWKIATASEQALSANWLREFGDEYLVELVAQALDNNFLLAEQRARLEEARAAISISRAARLPQLDLQFAAARRRALVADKAGATASNFDLGLDLVFELDLWGRLSDGQQRALLLFKASEAQYLDSRLRLAGAVARAWFDVITASQLVSLFEKRLANLEIDADIINSGYRQGINAALDVYQSNATLEQERARLLAQRQGLLESQIALQRLLAEYPNAAIDSDRLAAAALPQLETGIPAGLPSELLTRRPDLQGLWQELLAADKALAIAHKQRFPRLTLAATGSDVASNLGALFNGSALPWSVLGRLSQPLMHAGRLKAQQQQARYRALQAERRYLDAVYRAFAQVEAAITRDHSLRRQYQATVLQERNAEHARALSFEQYQGGLVSYTTALEAQRRAFDAQSRLIALRNQQVQTRIELYLALGGEFGPMP